MLRIKKRLGNIVNIFHKKMYYLLLAARTSLYDFFFITLVRYSSEKRRTSQLVTRIEGSLLSVCSFSLCRLHSGLTLNRECHAQAFTRPGPSRNTLNLIHDLVGSSWKIVKNRSGQLPSIFVTRKSVTSCDSS